MPNTREKPIELISKWDVVNKLIQLENNYQFYKEQWDADVLYRRICELEIGIGKTPGVTVQEWVSVKDRLPEEWKTVLVFIPSIDAIIPAKLRGGSWYATWDTTRLEYVSCWMPMPEKPNPLKGE